MSFENYRHNINTVEPFRMLQEPKQLHTHRIDYSETPIKCVVWLVIHRNMSLRLFGSCMKGSSSDNI